MASEAQLCVRELFLHPNASGAQLNNHLMKENHNIESPHEPHDQLPLIKVYQM